MKLLKNIVRMFRPSTHPVGCPFSTSESFRHFTEGLAALQAFEREKKQEKLTEAGEHFAECVRQWPQDMLPRFYLGIVRSIQDEPDFEETIRHFRYIVDNGPEIYRPNAQYNLAVAYYERGRSEDKETICRLTQEAIRGAAILRKKDKETLRRLASKLHDKVSA